MQEGGWQMQDPASIAGAVLVRCFRLKGPCEDAQARWGKLATWFSFQQLTSHSRV